MKLIVSAMLSAAIEAIQSVHPWHENHRDVVVAVQMDSSPTKCEVLPGSRFKLQSINNGSQFSTHGAKWTHVAILSLTTQYVLFTN